MHPLTAVHFFVLWKSNLGGSLTSFESHKLWPFLCLINTRRSLKQQLTEAFGRLSWLPFHAKSTWIRNYVVLKVLWFICLSQVVDHVALEIKAEEEERRSLFCAFRLSEKVFGFKVHDDAAFLRATCSWNYHALIRDVFGGKNSIKKYKNGWKVSRQFTQRYCKQLICSTIKQPWR